MTPYRERTALLGCVYAVQSKYEPAMAEAERAIALDPNNADSYASLANAFNSWGEDSEAIELIEKAMRLNPRYPFWYSFDSAGPTSLIGRYAEAIAAQKQALLRNPNWLFSYTHCFSYLSLGLATQ